MTISKSMLEKFCIEEGEIWEIPCEPGKYRVYKNELQWKPDGGDAWKSVETAEELSRIIKALGEYGPRRAIKARDRSAANAIKAMLPEAHAVKRNERLGVMTIYDDEGRELCTMRCPKCFAEYEGRLVKLSEITTEGARERLGEALIQLLGDTLGRLGEMADNEYIDRDEALAIFVKMMGEVRLQRHLDKHREEGMSKNERS